jgi:diguanylate cyclase (GGDEF)-like protein/PAS domain S-box-containing protein
LRIDELRAKDVLDQMGQIVLLVAPEGEILYANPVARRAYGYSLEALAGLHISAVRDDAATDLITEQLHKAANGGVVFQAVHKRSDGTTFPVVVHSNPISIGSQDALLSVVTDMTAFRSAAEALRESEERFRLLAENSGDVILRVVEGGVISWVSPSVTGAIGWAPEQLIGRPSISIVHPDDVAGFLDGRQRIVKRGDSVFRYRALTADGGYRWIESHAKPYYNSAGEQEGILAAIRVVDAQVQAERELERRARYDELTGVLVRRELLERLRSAATAAANAREQLAVMFCDVDHLKEVNERFGHAGGDLLLHKVARRLNASLRRSDLLGRVGGDEFLVVLLDAPEAAEVHAIAEKVRAAVSEPMEIAGVEALPTLSIGIAFVAPESDVDGAVRHADEALLEAKRAGRDRVVVW